MITSILASQVPHADLASITAIGGITLVRMPISPAEYLVLCQDGVTLAIRYLSPGELLHGIRQSTLHALWIDLKKLSPWSYVLIGGAMTPNSDRKIRLGDDVTGWSWESYQGAILTAQELGIGVLILPHAQDVPGTIETLARRSRKAVRAQPLREGLFYSPAEELLLALPGIGESKADALLSYCGDLASVLLALTWEESSVPGIGPETRRKVREVLGLKSDEVLGKLDAPEPARKAA